MTRLNAHVVYEAARRGDMIAREVVRDTARFLGTGLSNLINIFNPDTVVLAGGVTQAGEALMLPLQAEVKRRAFKSSVDSCRIVLGSLPMSAGVVGAVATFKERVLGSL
jgi:glucokinase